MLNFRRLPFVVLGACLLLASGAAAAEGDAFTATATPSHVKPSTSASYTVTLTNSPSSPSRGQRAKIAIPPGFDVSPATVQATTEALGGCDGSPWEGDGTLIADSKIHLKRPMGPETGLCQGAKLTVSFTATSPAAEGTHTWTSQLFVDDEEFLLNGSQPTIVVDGTAPETTIDSGPPVVTNSTSASFSFSSSETGSTFQCSLDGAAYTACTSPESYTVGAGAHTFEVRATDPAGNTDESADSHTWTVDVSAPQTTINSGPPAAANATSASFMFSSNEAGSSFQCSLDGAAYTACTSPESYTALGAGTHTFEVRATDPAGNTDATPDSHNWTVDLTAPETTINSGPPAVTNSTSASFTFSSNESGSSFQCSLDSAPFTTCTSPTNYTALSAGAHTFEVRATDPAGNTDATPDSHSWTVELTAPETTINSG
ncbi:MAG: hypothetical protein ACRDPL_16355, partial [Propionibacteriaceae bacterium]